MQSSLVYLPLFSALPCAKLITCIIHNTYIYETYVLTFSLSCPPLLCYSSILCNLECPPPQTAGELSPDCFEVLTCGANPPRRDLLLLCTTAVRFAAGDKGGVFVPQAVWAAVDNLLAHDDCRIFFVVLKSNATVSRPFLYTPIVIDYSNQAYANNGQENMQSINPIFMCLREIFLGRKQM